MAATAVDGNRMIQILQHFQSCSVYYVIRQQRKYRNNYDKALLFFVNLLFLGGRRW